MTTTPALTCRTAGQSFDPVDGRRSVPAAAPTAIPRWTRDPQSGQEQVEVAVPEDLRTSVRLTARALKTTPGSLWLAAHARVLQALSGESEIATGCVDTAGTWRCKLDLGHPSWRGLVAEAHDRQVRAGARPADTEQAGRGETRHEAASPGYEVVFGALQRDDAELPEGIVLGVTFRTVAGGEVLLLRYRRDVLDDGAALRIAGYHLAALRHLVADPEAEPADADLVDPDERRLQLEQLAGPERPRPQRRFHQLFEERVRLHPERIAAVQDTREWTYAELNARANRLARALLARGLQAEDVVAVVAERDLEWMAAVIGDPQGRRRVPTDRTAFPRRPDRQNAHPGREPDSADRGRQHRLAGRSTRRDALGRTGSSSRTSRPRGTPTTISAWRCVQTNSPTSTSPRAPRASRRAQCARTTGW